MVDGIVSVSMFEADTMTFITPTYIHMLWKVFIHLKKHILINSLSYNYFMLAQNIGIEIKLTNEQKIQLNNLG